MRPGSEAIRFREVTVDEATAQAADPERLHPDNLETVWRSDAMATTARCST